MNTQLFDQVDNYIRNLLGEEDEVLTTTIQSITDAGLPQISVSANQGKFLQILAMLCRAERILELGTLAGYSTIWLARAVPDGGKVITLEMDENHAAVARSNFKKAGLTNKIELRVGKALDMLPAMIAGNEGPFDMIFIDADKQPYAQYFEYALALSKPGTLIVCDNVIREGQVINADTQDDRVQGVQRLNELLARTTSVNATILQMIGPKGYDGMALAVVK